MVIHIFKDGTTTKELKNTYVPNEIMKRVHAISEKKEGVKSDQKKSSNKHS